MSIKYLSSPHLVEEPIIRSNNCLLQCEKKPITSFSTFPKSFKGNNSLHEYDSIEFKKDFIVSKDLPLKTNGKQ